MHKPATSQLQSPSGDRNVSPIPHPLPPSSLPQAKNAGMAAIGKDHVLSNQPSNNTFTNIGTKKFSSKTATTATATLTSGGIYEQQVQQQQLATITLTSMSAMSGTSTTAAKKDRVSSPFGAQRVASPSPILTITPSEGPPTVSARQKEPTTGGRKPKGKKAAGGQQTQRPTPYARPTPPPPSSSSTVSSIPQLGVPGLSIEPVVGPLLSPMLGTKLPPAASQTSKSGPQTVGPSGMSTSMKDLVASYTELLQKYPHMARSVLMNQKSLNTTTSGGPSGSQTTGGRKQSAKQAAKAAAAMSMQSSAGSVGSGIQPTTGGSAGGNRFGGSNMPRIGATITPLPAAGFSIDSYGRPTAAATTSGSGNSGNLASSAAAHTMQPMGVG